MRIVFLSILTLLLVHSCEILPYSVPPTPTSFAVTADSKTSIKLTWQHDSALESGFLIQRIMGRDENSETTDIPIAADLLTYTDSSLTSATQYSYRIKAVGVAGVDSYFSDYMNAITLSTINASTIAEPAPSDNYILRNPIVGHYYQLTATLSSDKAGMETYHDRWAYNGNGSDAGSYVYLCGDTNNTIDIIDNKFYNCRYGQFVFQYDGITDHWIPFTNDQLSSTDHVGGYVMPSTTTAWFGGMADYGGWSDNYGMCTVKIVDVTP